MLTPVHGIYYDSPGDVALGRTQDERQAKSIEVALSSLAGRLTEQAEQQAQAEAQKVASEVKASLPPTVSAYAQAAVAEHIPFFRQTLQELIAEADVRGEPGMPAPDAVPADEAVADYVKGPSTLTRAALDEAYLPFTRGTSLHNLDEYAGATDSQKLSAAIAELTASGSDAVLLVSRPVKLSETLEWDINRVSLDFLGNAIDASGVPGVAIQITNSTATLVPGNRRFMRNFTLRGAGPRAIGTVGFQFSTDDPTKTRNARGLSIENFEIERIETGLLVGNNAYLLRFFNGHIYRTTTCFEVDSKEGRNGAVNANYGENIAFYGVGFGNSKLGIKLGDNTFTDVNMHGCSFDFLQGGGQRLAVIKAGVVNFTDVHVEFNKELTDGPVVVVGPNASAEARFKGASFQHNGDPVSNVDSWFESLNPHGSGGITLRDVTLHNIRAESGFLCKGPGSFYAENVSMPSGTDGSWYGQGSVLGSEAQNLLRDATFSTEAQIDFYVTDEGQAATSRTESARVKVFNRDGTLVIKKKSAGACSVAVRVPARAGKWYSQAFTLATYSTDGEAAAGVLRMRDRFIAGPGPDSFNRPVAAKVLGRGDSRWAFSSLAGVDKAFQGVYSRSDPSPVSRRAPHWADFYEVVISLADAGVGEYVFSRFVITEL